MFLSYFGAFACGDGKVVYPVDGYDGETGHAVGNETTSGLAGKPNKGALCGLN